MPLLLWPFPSGTPTPPFVPRITTGKVFVIDAVPSIQEHAIYIFGPLPNLGESCALVFYVGGGLPIAPSPVLFTFVRPDGGIQVGDSRYAFIGDPTVFQRLVPSFPAGQYLVYIFDTGELSQRGPWKVSAIASNFFSNTYTFNVV